jgi:uncharacterized membrane protein
MGPGHTTVYVLALGSALCSAVATIFIRQGLRTSGSYTGFWINVAVGTAALWMAVVVMGGPGRVSAAGAALFVAAGLIGTVLGRLLRFVSIDVVGASISTALISVNPLIASALALLLLGERVTLPVALGTVVIIAGTVALSAGGRRLGVRPRHLVLPLGAATCFGVVAILRKLGVSGAGPVVGSAINATTALVAFTLFLVVSGQRDAMACRGRALACFAAAGLLENAAVLLTIVAFSLGSVSVVVPLIGAAPIFVLLLSPLFLRGVERLNARVVVGTVLIVLGVYLITTARV